MLATIGCKAALCGAPALCMALYSAGGALALCVALYSAGGIPGAPVRDIGAPGSMLICLCVTGGKANQQRARELLSGWLSLLEVTHAHQKSIRRIVELLTRYPWSGPGMS